MRYKNKTICVVDRGLFVEFAGLLSRSFGRVLYYSGGYQGAYPRNNNLLIGYGVEGVEPVTEFWSLIDEIDCFCFVDVFDGALAEYLSSVAKKPVWSSKLGEEMELNRPASKEWSKIAGIDIGKYKVVKGMDALRSHLKDHSNQWVKLNAVRGIAETFCAKTYNHVELLLDKIEHETGASSKILEFICEDNIGNAVEVGYDGYVVKGRFPKAATYGCEIKDKAFASMVTTYDKLPESVRSVNDKLAPAFNEYGYNGFFSSEIRCTADGKAYLIDPCCRAGSPPSELLSMLITNMPDIIWHGAHGELVEPEFSGKFGVELLISSEAALTSWLRLHVPKQYRDQVKIRNLAEIDGGIFHVPGLGPCSQIGAVVAVGDTMEDAIKECKHVAEKVQSYYLESSPEALDEAEKEMKKIMLDA